MRRTVVFALVASLAACSQPEPPARPSVSAEPSAQAHGAMHAMPASAQAANAAPAAGADGVRHFGAPIEGTAANVHLADVLNAPAQFQNRPIRIEGTVSAVCQEMGCWMEIRDDATQAHVRMHGHSFFLPRDISGKHAALEATLVAAHPATECDREAQHATGRVAQVELDATGVEIYN